LPHADWVSLRCRPARLWCGREKKYDSACKKCGDWELIGLQRATAAKDHQKQMKIRHGVRHGQACYGMSTYPVKLQPGTVPLQLML